MRTQLRDRFPFVASASTLIVSILPDPFRYTHSFVKAPRNWLYQCYWQIAFLPSQTKNDHLTHSYKLHGPPDYPGVFVYQKRILLWFMSKRILNFINPIELY